MALGMGMDALFSDNIIDEREQKTLRISEIEPNKNQPRKDFDMEKISELADSIREHGLIQPIVVRALPGNMTYQIVAGERRWRACRMAGLTEVPVVIKELSDEQVAQIALIENVQRADLNPVEEAIAYRDLIDTYGMTQEQVAKVMGKSRPYIANSLRLLNLSETVQMGLREGKITAGHAKALMAIEDKDKIDEAFGQIVDKHLNVRQTEQLAADINLGEELPAIAAKPEEKQRRNYFTEMELSLHEKLGRKIKISGKSNGKGTITFDFFDQDDLVHISEVLMQLAGNEE